MCMFSSWNALVLKWALLKIAKIGQNGTFNFLDQKICLCNFLHHLHIFTWKELWRRILGKLWISFHKIVNMWKLCPIFWLASFAYPMKNSSTFRKGKACFISEKLKKSLQFEKSRKNGRIYSTYKSQKVKVVRKSEPTCKKFPVCKPEGSFRVDHTWSLYYTIKKRPTNWTQTNGHPQKIWI